MSSEPDMTASELDMTGKVALVTGGGRGIGMEIAKRFLQAGATTVVCGRKEPEQLPSWGTAQVAFVAADVRDPDQVANLTAAIVERFGRLDICINNAGGSPPVDAATASPRLSEQIIRLNLLGPLHVSREANAVMQNQDTGGSIVNIASVSGVRPSPGTAAYGAAKAGLLSLTTSLAIEWAPRVRVNAITAGLIRTELAPLHYGDEAGIAAVAATIPMLRMGEPLDIANACLFLASPLASFITGSNLLVHGGGEKPAFLAAASSGVAAGPKT
jgi:NAD(P)-dependent dehydrogenase (short-subunit alcohol dehydrogenase family)